MQIYDITIYVLLLLLKLGGKNNQTAKSYFPPILVLLIKSSVCNCKLVLYTDTCILAINFILSYIILKILKSLLIAIRGSAD